jgi:hypothetical protein
MEDRIGLPEMIEELVTEPLALVRIRDESRYIDHVHRDKTVPVNAFPAFDFEFFARALCAYITHPEIWVDGSKRVIGDLSIRQGRCLEKGRFSTVGFSCKR